MGEEIMNMWPFKKRKNYTREECVWLNENSQIICEKLYIEPHYDLEEGKKYLTICQLEIVLREVVERL
jgi:hypothetical protein